jgi:ribosomal protein S18 acetylase RimI-like enzyme
MRRMRWFCQPPDQRAPDSSNQTLISSSRTRHRPVQRIPKCCHKRRSFWQLGQPFWLMASTQLFLFANIQTLHFVDAFFLSTTPASSWKRSSIIGNETVCRSPQRNVPFWGGSQVLFFCNCNSALSNNDRSVHQRSRRFYTTTTLHLFFPRSKTDQDATAERTKIVSRQTMEELQSSTVTFPYRIRFQENEILDDNNNPKGPLETDHDDNEEDEELIVRFMTPEDIPELVPLCIQEFGEGSFRKPVQQSTLQNFPWREPNRMRVWWDQLCFEKTVSWTLQLKLRPNHQHFQSSSTATTSSKKFQDPAMLVLARRRRMRNDEDDDLDFSEENIVGMVELSLQPPNCDRNPPALPLPLWVKESLARNTELGSLQGWVSNLLIDPSFRGLGYSKLLMAATEGVARSWQCQYIFLHADADIQSGRIPQRLYESLGYQVVKGEGKEEYSWAGTASGLDHFSSIRMVDGVALLCFSKKLL